VPTIDDDLPPFARTLPVTAQAIAFAAMRHAEQTRQVDEAPFILHPLEVAMLLHGRGYHDEVVAAGALHDVLEKTDATRAELVGHFGEHVAALVAAVSDAPGVEDYAARKAALREQVARASSDAQAIYTADKLAKVRELRALAARLHLSLNEPRVRQRLEHYERSLTMVEAALPGSPMVEQLRFELWALRHLPPR
jgi:(p)ppGpp synthase/HD superfamily hydrolase